VKSLFEAHSDARFLVVSQGDHDAIRRMLSEEGVNLDRVEVRSASFASVADEIARMDAGIFFIKPAFSKRASCPTRMGEFLGCGKPCLANSGVGDVAEDLTETGTGIAVDAFDAATLENAVRNIVQLAEEPGIGVRCRKAAEERFALELGVATYSSIYRSLLQA
jgi:glycosyltransferase involved in cell wall biosynthesis